MILKNPPLRASRRALKACFTKVDPATWDYIFDIEKQNGLHVYRVQGPNSKAFYSTDGVVQWLCEMGYYTPADFEQTENVRNHWSGLVTRAHTLVG